MIATWAGQADDCPRALTAHVDTLGAMVQEIKSNGRLKLTQIGGYVWNSVEGEGCTVMTADGRSWSGTILLTKASVHVHGQEVRKLERKGENMEVRLDARTTSAEETRELGIEVGDFVALDPRVQVTETGFVRSRHLDDKAGVTVIVGAIKALADAGWIGEIGPGPSYLDPGSGGPENDFTNRNTTFMTWNLMHLARMIKDAGGIPAHGNQRSKWDAGCRFDHPNPEYR